MPQRGLEPLELVTGRVPPARDALDLIWLEDAFQVGQLLQRHGIRHVHVEGHGVERREETAETGRELARSRYRMTARQLPVADRAPGKIGMSGLDPPLGSGIRAGSLPASSGENASSVA